MEPDPSWGEDTVGLGRRREEPTRPDAHDHRRGRPGGRLRKPTLRVVVGAAAGIVAVLALLAVLGGGSDSGPAPIREVADPAPSIVVSPPTPPRRKELREAPGHALKRPPKGQLEQRDREPKASGPAHELAMPEAIEAAPESAPPPVEPAPATSTPTPPAVEFGL